MKIAIIGAGNIGGTLGRLWVGAGHDVFFGLRHPEQARSLLAELGDNARAGTVAEAIDSATLIVFAGPYGALPDLARDYLQALKGKTLVDAANPYRNRDGALADAAIEAAGGSGSYTAGLLPGVQVVKAFNTVYWLDLRDKAHRAGERLAMPLAGDDPAAVARVMQLAKDAGFDPVAVGGLSQSARLDPGSPIYAKSLTAAGVRTTLHL